MLYKFFPRFSEAKFPGLSSNDPQNNGQFSTVTISISIYTKVYQNLFRDFTKNLLIVLQIILNVQTYKIGLRYEKKITHNVELLPLCGYASFPKLNIFKY